MQISNSVGVPIGSHADPAGGPGHLASQLLSGGRAPQPVAEKSTAASNRPADSANPVAGQNGAPGPDSPDQRVGRPNSYAARRDARKTNQQPDATVNGVPVASTRQDAPPAHFLAILDDVQDTQAGVAKAQATSSYVLSQLAGTALSANYAAPISTVTNPSGQVSSESKPAPAEPVAPNPTDGGNSQVNTDAPNATQQVPVRAIDALLATDQAVVSQLGNESKGSAASSAEVAFAAQVALKAAEPRAIAPNDGQAAIAASRFEAASKPATSQPAAEFAVLAQPEAPVAAPQFESMGSDSGSGEHRDRAEPNAVSAQSAGTDQNIQAASPIGTTTQPAASAMPAASPAIAVQPATGRTQGSPASSVAMTAKNTAPGQAASSALSGPQNASSGIVAAAPASVEAPNGRASTNPKPVPQEHIAQDVEARNEPVERAADAIRDISLNLSTKDQNVQVRLSERGGELHVTVRTPDSTLTHGLREGLSDLVGRLERGGYRAETWQPGSDSRDRGHDSSRRGFSQQQNAGGKGSGRQQNSQDSESENQTPKWIGELESSFQKE